ncbi:MAG: molybdopterin-dependent oxidoreductase, partial [Nitrospinota bacterium]
MGVTRRQFLGMVAAAGAGTLVADRGLALAGLKPTVQVGNPLESYPDRDWEKVYRDQYRYDDTFAYVCSPNDTHACRMRAYVRNGVVMRIEQNYDVDRYADLDGNRATVNWNPRGCLKGYTLHRRVYGPYRLKYPIVRKGWKEWADAGFPELTPELRSKYRFDARGQDDFVRLYWEDAYTYIAKGMVAIAKRYSGPDGARRLRDQGYPPEMIEEMGGAGTRTIKLRGGMGLLGVFGKYGLYRFSNMLAILDGLIRGVDPDRARGGRNWSNYTWHGDQAPGHPWVHGLQTSDCDFNDLRFSKLLIMAGKNLVENKMPESHFFIECMERGAKIVVVAPEYGPPSTKADYWIPIRPQSDTALFLGIAKILIDENRFDVEFVKRFTDFPLLVRTDTLKRLRPQDFIPGYREADLSRGPSARIQGLKGEQRKAIGDFAVWDAKSGGPKAITRDDVGRKMAAKGIDPALEGRYTVKTVNGKEVEVMPLFEMYRIHLKDYDLETVHRITHAPKKLILRLAEDIATIKPAAIHQGEGINHYFHATEINRSAYLPMMLTGNIGVPGAGVHTWAGNYKAGVFQGSAWTGPGFAGWVKEDPFHPNLDPNASGRSVK